MFRHGRYSNACLLSFPPNALARLPQPSMHSTLTPSSSPQRLDPLATNYGTIDDLCDLCIGYGAMPVLERVIATRNTGSSTQDTLVSQHAVAALARICNYYETHRHFNHLYRFQVLKKDHVATDPTWPARHINSHAMTFITSHDVTDCQWLHLHENCCLLSSNRHIVSTALGTFLGASISAVGTSQQQQPLQFSLMFNFLQQSPYNRQ
eukprot:Gb_09854 [translate_table: standard]